MNTTNTTQELQLAKKAITPQNDALYLALLTQDWKQARMLLSNNDSDYAADLVKNQRYNMLYAACTYNDNHHNPVPMDIIMTIHRISPKQILYRDGNGRTILHISCYRSHHRVVQFLLLHAPQSATLPDRYGKLPLHLALRYSNTYSGGGLLLIVEYLLDIYPKALFMKDQKRKTPLDYFVQRWNKLLQRVYRKYTYFHIVPSNDLDYEDLHTIKSIFSLILKAEKRHSFIPHSNLPFSSKTNLIPLNKAFLSKTIPSLSMFLLLDLIPFSEFEKKDSCGNTLLHIALSTFPYKIKDNDSSIMYLIVKSLLEKNSSVTIERNDSGQLPLALAIQHGFSWNIIHTIIKAAPITISLIVDTKERLFPFMMAAVPHVLSRRFLSSLPPFSSDSDDDLVYNDSLSIIYSLLRLDPSLVKSAIPIFNTKNEAEKYDQKAPSSPNHDESTYRPQKIRKMY